MNIINITPTLVAFQTIANAVSFDILATPLPPTSFNLNARFFFVENNKVTKEVANVPFALPLEDYNTWSSDVELTNKCLAALNLTKDGI